MGHGPQHEALRRHLEQLGYVFFPYIGSAWSKAEKGLRAPQATGSCGPTGCQSGSTDFASRDLCGGKLEIRHFVRRLRRAEADPSVKIRRVAAAARRSAISNFSSRTARSSRSTGINSTFWRCCFAGISGSLGFARAKARRLVKPGFRPDPGRFAAPAVRHQPTSA
jgi:hypothetical protein